MAIVTSNEYDHIDVVNGSNTNRHYIKDATARSALANKAPLNGGPNRINPATVETGLINSAGGISVAGDWAHTDYIEVTPGETLYVYGTSGANYCTYDANRSIVSHSTNFTGTYTVPDGVYFIRATVYGPDVGKTAYISDVNYYTSFQTVYQYTHELEADMNTNIDSIADLAEFTNIGFINKESGALISNNDYKTTDFIPISGVVYPIKLYCKSVNLVALYALYDKNKVFLSSVSVTNSGLTIETHVIMPESFSDAAYIRITSAITNNFEPFAQVAKIANNKIAGKVVGIGNVEFTEHDDRTNLIDSNALTANSYVSGDNGNLVTGNGFYATDFVPMKPKTKYYFNNNYVYRGYCAFYDSDKTYISGFGAASASNYLPSPFETPAGTAYGRFTIVAQANIVNAWVCEYNRMSVKPLESTEKLVITSAPENPAEYTGNEISVFNKILCIGDSLTEGFFNENGGSKFVMKNRSFPAKLQTLTGVECTNLGESGKTSTQWYTEHSSDDLSGHDACIIQLGVNDQLQNVSESDMDSALTSIINKVKSDNTGIKIFVATIVPANGYMTTAMRTRSQMIRDFVDGLDDSNVFLVDMWAYGHTNDLLAYDAGHLSALGYLRLAEDYKSYISYVIRNNADDFRYVQFIGTNYSYNADTEARLITY